MEMVQLKNGSSELRVLVATVMLTIEGLWKEGLTGMCHVAELAGRCKDPVSEIDPSSEQLLKELALLERDGQPRDSIRNIVLSMSDGEGVNMKLVSPVKES